MSSRAKSPAWKLSRNPEAGSCRVSTLPLVTTAVAPGPTCSTCLHQDASCHHTAQAWLVTGRPFLPQLGASYTKTLVFGCICCLPLTVAPGPTCSTCLNHGASCHHTTQAWLVTGRPFLRLFRVSLLVDQPLDPSSAGAGSWVSLWTKQMQCAGIAALILQSHSEQWNGRATGSCR